MREVAIVADDLTGALDSAAAFASPAAPIAVGWQPPVGARIAFDSESRALAPAEVQTRMQAWLPMLANSRIAFKKVDSLLRGNSFVEIAGCCRAGAFRSICIAPAFPAQGRITVEGRQQVVQSETPPVAILERLQELGIDAIAVPAGGRVPKQGSFVCDARSDGDLRHLVQSLGASDDEILWCGSAGLAHALGGDREPRASIRRPRLAIIGSRHTISRSDAARLSTRLGPRAFRLTEVARAAETGDAVAAALRAGRPAALGFDLPELAPEIAEATYHSAFERLAAAPPPETLIVVGGDTLFRLARAIEADRFETFGHFAPGLPVSRIRGGPWDGTEIISKSGAFDDAGLFADFVQEELKRA